MRHNRTLSSRVEGERAHAPAGYRPARWAALAILMAASVVAGTYAAGGEAAARARLSTISAKAGAGGTSVLIEASEPVAYATSRPDPLTVLVDLRNATTAGAVNRLAAASVGRVAAVTLEDTRASDGAPVARVRLLLSSPAEHVVRSDRNTILVDVGQDAASGAQPQVPAPPRPPSASPAAASGAGAATRLEGITTSPSGPVEVTLKGNGLLTPAATELTPAKPYRLVMDFNGVSSGLAAATPVNKGPIQRIRVAAHSLKPLVTRVVFDLANAVTFKLSPSGNELKVVLEPVASEVPTAVAAAKAPAAKTAASAPARTAPVAPAPAKAAPVAPTPAKTVSNAPARTAAAAPRPARTRRAVAPLPTQAAEKPAVEKPAAEQPAAPKPVAPAPAPVQAPPVAQAPAKLPQGMVGATSSQTGRQYSGHPISLDFQGADLRSVLRIFSVDTGLNIVIDPSVQGSVDVALRDVPWDQALDIILRANKLGWVADGTIVRVAPLSVLADEEVQRRKLADEQALSGELKVMTHTLSYAKAEDIKSLLASVLTKRGDVQVDARTNTVIMRDLQSGLDTARTLLGSVDRPQPQVEIEARIVQTTREFSRTIGVQWGLNGRAAPDLANTTGLAFPNSVQVGGRTGGTQSTGSQTSSTAINLGTTAATSALGIALGSVNGAFNLDLALSALEKSGKGRILSTPRVSTQNNVEAEVMQGTQIPIQTIANNTVTVSFKDAALTLKVTPQITASNTVIMNITLENAAPDYTRVVNLIPPIDTQRARTTVLVKDGDTTVIGGIYVSQEQASVGRTPGLSRIPLLGWLFKRDESTDSSRELLIFITPRIAKM
jgi:type IV pilus secretin PilQ/predicted competence protein